MGTNLLFDKAYMVSKKQISTSLYLKNSQTCQYFDSSKTA